MGMEALTRGNEVIKATKEWKNRTLPKLIQLKSKTLFFQHLNERWIVENK